MSQNVLLVSFNAQKNLSQAKCFILWTKSIITHFSHIKLGRCKDSFGGMYVGSFCWYRQNWFSLCESSEPKSTRMLSPHLPWFDCWRYHLLRSWWRKFCYDPIPPHGTLNDPRWPQMTPNDPGWPQNFRWITMIFSRWPSIYLHLILSLLLFFHQLY